MTRQLGYCTNVHAGADLQRMLHNLDQHAVAVKRRFSPTQPMGIGLWLAAPAARELQDPQRSGDLARWLEQRGLIPFTLNGFPFGDFHEPVVKHRVYEPTWFEASRFDYTLDLVRALHAILPAGLEGSISTLPIAWGGTRPEREPLALAARYLQRVADHLAELEASHGRLIYLCLEPEPGCVLERSDDVVRFFKECLLPGGDRERILRYIRVCHDVCHAAVMFENQADVVARYAEHDIQIGKVQVSSAVRVLCEPDAAVPADAQLTGLGAFAEDRYLHQTMVRCLNDDTCQFFEDLPAALAANRPATGKTAEWRVHFHVPIYLEQFGVIGTTRNEIDECLAALAQHSQVAHFEVETYAWGVLPEELQQPELAAGIAREMQWLSERKTFATL